VAYIGGALKHAGFTDITCVDAMTNHIDDAALRRRLVELKPDAVLATAITPMIYQAQKTLEIAKEVNPHAHTILGGIHPTFMYQQVFHEAPWIDYIVRGEGEQIIAELPQYLRDGTALATRRDIKGIAFVEDGPVVATPARPPVHLPLLQPVDVLAQVPHA
jgi:anaerobic magnesium-protoporphyrin IX monomethyl ester cyclase